MALLCQVAEISQQGVLPKCDALSGHQLGDEVNHQDLPKYNAHFQCQGALLCEYAKIGYQGMLLETLISHQGVPQGQVVIICRR